MVAGICLEVDFAVHECIELKANIDYLFTKGAFYCWRRERGCRIEAMLRVEILRIWSSPTGCLREAWSQAPVLRSIFYQMSNMSLFIDKSKHGCARVRFTVFKKLLNISMRRFPSN